MPRRLSYLRVLENQELREKKRHIESSTTRVPVVSTGDAEATPHRPAETW